MGLDWEIVDSILDKTRFFVDRYDRYAIYAEYRKEKGCLEFYPIDSRDFESYLDVSYRDLSKSRKLPNMGEVFRYIKDEANYYENLDKVSPYTRVAGNLKDGIEYSLADHMHHIVSITDRGWKITEKTKHKFLSNGSNGEQVMPKRSNKSLLELLAPLVNLKGDDLRLFAIWLTQAFSCGSHYGVMLSAEQGSGKSSLTRTINLLVDPSDTDPPLMQTKLEDFQNYLANHYFACFDNVRNIPTEFSDTLCAAITGSTVVKRKLYSDRDEVRLKLHNTVVINGINIFPKESDLAERFLYFNLKKLPPSGRKTDYDLTKIFEKNRPLILGCIFDLLVKASKIIKKMQAEAPERMADAFTEMMAIAMALGLSKNEFRHLIAKNVEQLNAVCLPSPVVQAVVQYMDGPNAGKRKVVETATTFYNSVKANYSGDKADLFSRPAEFSKALKSEVGALMKAGFGCLVDDTGEANSMITVIRNKK